MSTISFNPHNIVRSVLQSPFGSCGSELLWNLPKVTLLEHRVYAINYYTNLPERGPCSRTKVPREGTLAQFSATPYRKTSEVNQSADTSSAVTTQELAGDSWVPP